MWVAVDFDGTLVKLDHNWRTDNGIGEPIKPMVDFVKDMLFKGVDVKIFTARASMPELIPPIQDWCEEHLGQRLEVTNVKDFGCVAIYDDIAFKVETNTGRIIG